MSALSKPLRPGRVMMVSLGCAKNLVDSEEVLGSLIEAGWQVTDEAESADLIIINTCGFIQPAVEEAVDAILEAVTAKALLPARLVVMGCLVQRFGRKLGRNMPEVDLWLGPGEFARLFPRRLLGRHQAGFHQIEQVKVLFGELLLCGGLPVEGRHLRLGRVELPALIVGVALKRMLLPAPVASASCTSGRLR